ncbi:DNA translocase FtsK [Actinomadura sp. GTD37]|uniref:DNA translocase FtsK n=1 Tax=Actinomadura sp. GTD37 TaxID=1778030 RepID=UPI0035C1920A
MARKQTLEVAQQEGMERLVVAGVSRIAVLLPPWILMLLLLIVGAIAHHVWGAPPAVTWTTMAGTLCTAALTALTWVISHQRGMLGRAHSTLTTGGAGLWFVVANITGVTAPVTFTAWAFGGATLSLAWNFRAVIRQTASESAQVDPLKALFEGAKAKAGIEGAKLRTKEITAAKATGELTVPDGKTVADVQKKVDVLEAASEVPPGSINIAKNEDNAGRAHFTIADPRVMNKSIPWPGPSRAGESIAQPLRLGIFQDAEPVELLATGANLQIMGASGSGKSIGGGWNYLGEAITRSDVAVFAMDISKGDQTLGPLRPALHRLETTKAGASKLIEDVYSSLSERTNWLTARGYTDWEEGCGLAYWVFYMEEAAKAFRQLSDTSVEQLEEIAKEIRSAGGRLAVSLQKSIFSEMSTVVRSQLSYMCFGLNADDDTSYGLSAKQQALDVDPALWGAGRSEHQGKAFLDAPGVPDTHIAVPLRTYDWGPKSQAAAVMAAHAAQFPATARRGDEFTQRIAGPGGSAALPSGGQAIPMPAASTPAAPAVQENAQAGDVPADLADALGFAAELVIATQGASTQMLQRKLRLSHKDCLRVMEVLERKGIIGPAQDGGLREVLIASDEAAEALEDLRRDGDPVAAYVTTPDPDPEVTAGPYDEIREPTEEENAIETPPAKVARMSPEASRRLVEDWILHRHSLGELSFTSSDDELRVIRDRTGNTSRTWAHNVLSRLADEGVLEKDNSGKSTVFRIRDLAPLGGVPA